MKYSLFSFVFINFYSVCDKIICNIIKLKNVVKIDNHERKCEGAVVELLISSIVCI